MNRIFKHPSADQKSNKQGVNWMAIVLSLFLSIGLWVYVLAVESPASQSTVQSVRVEFSGLETMRNHGYTVLSGENIQVDVTLRGRQSELARLTPEEVYAKVDLSDIEKAGTYEKKIQITPPSGMQFVSCSPEYILVDVDRETQDTFDVREPDTIGSVAAGLSYECVPSVKQVSVSGPASVLERIDSVRCQVDLGEFTQSKEVRAPVRLVDENGAEVVNSYLTVTPAVITFDYQLYKEAKVDLILNVNTHLSSERIEAQVTPASVTLRGEPAVIDSYVESGLALSASALDSREFDFHEKTIPETVFILPEGLTTTDGSATITYQAVVRHLSDSYKSRTWTLDLSEATVECAPGMTATLSEERIQGIRVRVDSEASGVNSSCLRAEVDLSGYTQSGTYKDVPVIVTISDEYKNLCYVEGVYTTNVTIEAK